MYQYKPGTHQNPCSCTTGHDSRWTGIRAQKHGLGIRRSWEGRGENEGGSVAEGLIHPAWQVDLTRASVASAGRSEQEPSRSAQEKIRASPAGSGSRGCHGDEVPSIIINGFSDFRFDLDFRFGSGLVT